MPQQLKTTKAKARKHAVENLGITTLSEILCVKGNNPPQLQRDPGRIWLTNGIHILTINKQQQKHILENPGIAT